jgi:hypothetical protein
MRFFDHLHPFLGGDIVIPVVLFISYRRFGLGFGDDIFPENHGPLESLSGFL